MCMVSAGNREQPMEGQFGARGFEGAAPISTDAIPVPSPGRLIGTVTEIAGSSSMVMLDARALESLAGNGDVAIAHAGQVGSQVKMRVGNTWLIANVRSLRLADRGLAPQVAFLREGDRERRPGK